MNVVKVPVIFIIPVPYHNEFYKLFNHVIDSVKKALTSIFLTNKSDI